MQWNLKLVLTAAWTFTGVFVYLVVPGIAPLLLPLAAIAPVLWHGPQGLAGRKNVSGLVALLAAASCYLLASTSWAPAPGYGYTAAATLLIGAVTLHVVTNTIPLLECQPLRAMTIGFYAGYAVAALLTCVEIIFDNPLHLLLYEAVPRLAPAGTTIEQGIVGGLPPYFLNAQIAALVFLFWPVVLVATQLGASVRSRLLLLAGVVGQCIPAVFLSQHKSSMVTIIAVALFFCLQMVFPRFVRPLLKAGWVVACVAAIPLFHLPYDLKLQSADWLPSSGDLGCYRREDVGGTLAGSRRWGCSGVGTASQAKSGTGTRHELPALARPARAQYVSSDLGRNWRSRRSNAARSRATGTGGHCASEPRAAASAVCSIHDQCIAFSLDVQRLGKLVSGLAYALRHVRGAGL